MTIANGSEWDDIPSSSELFGGDFFGDELMEMYSAIGDATSAAPVATAPAAKAPSAAQEAVEDDSRSHPGLLIAMNAAAMDGGLSPLGSGPEHQFVPMAATSNVDAVPSAEESALPPYSSTATGAAAAAVCVKVEETAKAPTTVAPSPPATPVAVVPATTTSAPVAPAPAVAAKRPVATVAAPVQGPTKKRKPAVPQAKVAATGGVKVTLPPGVAVASSTTPLVVRAISPSSLRQGIIKPAPVTAVSAAVGVVRPVPKTVPATLKKVPTLTPAPAATGVKTTVVPKSKMPLGGGINHQVVVRPSVVPSSSAGAMRIIAPAPTPSVGSIVRTTSGITSGGKLIPSTTTPTGVIRAKSEADFKDVASAAVSSLIQNATGTLTKTGPKPPSTTKPADKTVDVSTAHINALTSQNWVTACNPIPTPDVSSASLAAANASACDKAARNARRATLTQEERAKQNRDRNREHARNTRLRKKAYVEELKRTLTELVAQRDAAELEKRHDAQRNREQREVRFRVMEEFLKLRGRNELNAARWVAILEDGFTFTLPRTTFRRMIESATNDVSGSGTSTRSSIEQVLRGASAVMEDSQHLSTYLQSICSNNTSIANQVQIAYNCDRKRFFMDGNIAFMNFDANTLGAIARGAPYEASLKGSVRATFSPASNKLISVDLEFDTAAFIAQIEAMGDVSTTAAAVAANEADALLDSLQMPQIFVDKESDNISSAVPGPASVSSDDGDRSTDGSTALPIA
mmetsp:Transcript_25793/g.44030  ORF Transcript_25793/g.44030 Transcript_25793/m.44030 type:complete len:745 (-) Transcript_25793:272-2506(-)|eukprot:CAMPEP_0183731548 /NCGR_PEP_ID=MMETSP0737-20130205/35701_1 /TAXON_ID=385413 /ORGANISM="Thalassiosira miniscula, Strain CCMP1093" /LENGTH=744 /DNA_ID=CAMNT_0025964297 /DNA_START=784 /DNA_END=3018 /DNA_ORIENTATION=-